MTGSCLCGAVRATPPAYRRVFCHLLVCGKAPWFEISDGLPRFDQGPDRKRMP